MELIIRNKWFSLRGSSYIRDVNEQDIIRVKGKFWTVTYKKFIQTLEGETKYIVRNKFWKLFVYRAFIIDPKTNEIITTIRRKFWSLHDHYTINSPYGEIVIRGNILCFDYHIYLNGVEIGHVARKISLRDSFVLTLPDDIDDVYYYVALVIAIANITRERANDSSSYYDYN